MNDKKVMQVGRIYSITYAGTQLIARYKGDSVCNHLLFDYLHYWQGYETFYHGSVCHCVKDGIEEIREATPCEKQTLVKKEIEKNAL